MTSQKRTLRSAATEPAQSRVIQSGSQSSPLLTPLALLLLGMVQMARAQSESVQTIGHGEPLPTVPAQGQEPAATAEEASAPAESVADAPPALAELLALLQELADGARQAAAQVLEEGAQPVAAVQDAAQAEQVLSEGGAERLGQMDRAEAIVEAYQDLIAQLPADLVLAQAPAAAAGESAGGAAAAGAGGASMGALLGGLLGLVALGAGGGSSDSAGGTDTEITLHDGYITGASVYLDINGNGVVDGADRLVGTTVDGKVTVKLTDADKQYSLIGQGGTDISTGAVFVGAFSTTAGSTVINPLTTLVQTLVQSTISALGTLTPEQKTAALAEAKTAALSTVATALGIDTDVDLTKIDTVKASANAGDTALGVQASDAIELHSKALMVANMISVGAATLAGAAGNPSAATDLSKFVVQGIVGTMNAAAASGEAVSFKTADAITQIMSSAVDAAKTAATTPLDDAVLSSATASVAGAVAATNQLINAFASEAAQAVAAAPSNTSAATAGLTQMLQAQKVVLNQVQGLKDADTSALTQLANLSDVSAVLTQSRTITEGLKVGTTSVTAVTTAPTDTTAPTVESVAVRPARAGDLAQVVVKMSETVLVKITDTARPTLQVTTSADGAPNPTTATALYEPGLSFGDTLVFTYRVQPTDARVAVANGATIALPNADVTIRDLAGNAAVRTIAQGGAASVDSVAPTVTLTAADSFVRAGATTIVTFQLSEAASARTGSNFTVDDVKVDNGTLTEFTRVNATQFTAKLAATSATAPAVVSIDGGRFTDLAGNANQPSNKLVVAREGAAPSVALSAEKSFFNSVNTQGSPSTQLKFSLSGDTTEFTQDDISVTGGGSITAFQGSGRAYTATLTGITANTQVKVVKDAFGVAGTTAKNAESNPLTFSVDTSSPTVAISLLKGTTGTEAVTSATVLKAGEFARVTFTLTEAARGFGPQAVKVTGGFLEGFAQDRTDPLKFTALFRPAAPEAGTTAVVDASISVDAARFGDLAGNPNQAATPATFRIDNVRPAVTSVTDNLSGVAKIGSEVTYTYTFNKPVTGLAAGDFTVVNGSIKSVQAVTAGDAGSAAWNVTVTPNSNVQGGAGQQIRLSLATGAVSDAAGNQNLPHAQATQAIDTVAPTATLELSRATYLKASANGGQAMTGTLTVNFNEPVATLTAGAFSVSGAGGTITGLTRVGEGRQWTAIFTPTEAEAAGTVRISLAAGYLDAAGNTGAAASSADLRTNVVAPVLNISADKTLLKVGETAALTFNFSEAVSGFEASDVTVTGGTIGGFTKVSDTQWTAVFTPTAGNAMTSPTITVADGRFVSTSANIEGITRTTPNIKANLTNPTLTITLDQPTADGVLVYAVQVSDASVTGLTASDFTATNGTVVANSLQAVQGQAGRYTLRVEPTATGNVTVSAAEGAGTAQLAGTPLLSTAAASSTPIRVIMGTSGNDTLDLTDAREVVVLGAGNDVIRVDEATDSGAAARDLVAGVSLGDRLDISALFNKAGTTRQYFSVVDKEYTGPAVAGWLKVVDRSTLDALGTVGDNELRFIEKVEGGQLTLTFAYDADSSVGTNVVSQTFEGRLLAADGAALQGFLNRDNNGESNYVIADKVAPTLTVSMLGNKTVFAKTNPGTGTAVFTSNEILDALPSSALNVSGGTLTAPVRSSTDPRVWTATFTPSSDLSVTEGAISVKASAYSDMQNNVGPASNAVSLTLNSNAPLLTLAARSLTADGDLLFDVRSSDPTVTGLAASDFTATNGTVVASSFQAVAGQAGQFTVRVTPTATGEVTLSAAEGAGTANSLPTMAASSPPAVVIKGTSGADVIELTNVRQGVILGGGDDVVRIDDISDSPEAGPDMIAGVAAGDKLDISALLKKAGTPTQYISAVDTSYTGAPVAGWLKAIDRSAQGDLGTVGDNELRYMVKKVDGIDRLSMSFDTDSSVGTTSASGVGAIDLVATNATVLQGFLAGTNNRGFWTADTTAPTLSVSIDKTTFNRTNPGTAVVRFTSNEILAALPASAVTVVGGTISAPVQSSLNPREWTATFTPTSNTSVTSGSISVAASAYQDWAGNPGSASNSQALTLNAAVPVLSLNFNDATVSGQMVFKLISDQTLTGLDASDFAGTGYTVNSVTPVTGSSGRQFDVTLTPTADGNIALALAAGAANGTTLPTPAVTAAPASLQVVRATAQGGTIDLTGATDRLVVLGQGADVVKLAGVATSAGTGTVNAGILAGVAAGDQLDISSIIRAAGGTGYTSVAEADLPDTGAGFVEIEKLTLTKGASTTTVTFDITLDADNINGNRIEGFKFDLKYDYALVTGVTSSVTSISIADGVSIPTWNPIQPNLRTTTTNSVVTLSNGQIAGVLDQNYASEARLVDTTGYTDGSGKIVGVRLVIGGLVDSFKVGFDAQAAGGDTFLNVAGSTQKIYPSVGVGKTAGVTGVTANVLSVLKESVTVTADTNDSNLPGLSSPATDNQLKILQITETGSEWGMLKFQYDTNPAKGEVALSPVVEVDVISSNLANFFASDYIKLL